MLCNALPWYCTDETHFKCLEADSSDSRGGESESTNDIDDATVAVVAAAAGARRAAAGAAVGAAAGRVVVIVRVVVRAIAHVHVVSCLWHNVFGTVGVAHDAHRAVAVRVDWAVRGQACGLAVVAGTRGEGRGRRAAVAERRVEGHAHSHGVFVTYTKAGGRAADLLDEVAELRRVQVHETVHIAHGRVALVVLERRRLVLHRAAKERTKDLVQVRDQGVLVAVIVIGSHVHLERVSTAAVEEVDSDSLIVTVRACKRAVKVLVRESINIWMSLWE